MLAGGAWSARAWLVPPSLVCVFPGEHTKQSPQGLMAQAAHASERDSSSSHENASPVWDLAAAAINAQQSADSRTTTCAFASWTWTTTSSQDGRPRIRQVLSDSSLDFFDHSNSHLFGARAVQEANETAALLVQEEERTRIEEMERQARQGAQNRSKKERARKRRELRRHTDRDRRVAEALDEKTTIEGRIRERSTGAVRQCIDVARTLIAGGEEEEALRRLRTAMERYHEFCDEAVRNECRSMRLRLRAHDEAPTLATTADSDTVAALRTTLRCSFNVEDIRAALLVAFPYRESPSMSEAISEAQTRLKQAKSYGASSHVDDTLCVVCMETERTATLVHGDTGHTCCCLACAKDLQQREQPCPMCRNPIEAVIRTFL